MIQPKLTGRLGNFLFQVATAYAYSLRHNMEYNIPDFGNGVDPGTIRKYLNWFPNINSNGTIKPPFFHWNEPDHGYTPIPYHENIFIQDYFQSEKYFKDFRKEVLAMFNVKRLMINPYADYVSIHVRRGDYVKFHTSFPPIDHRYLRPAIAIMLKNGFNKFLVFGDDLVWNRANVNTEKFPTCEFKYCNGNEFEDLTLMSNCRHHIIANSSFSWWGAWLNPSEDKLVVSPSKSNWFGPRMPAKRDDIIPDSWIQITY